MAKGESLLHRAASALARVLRRKHEEEETPVKRVAASGNGRARQTQRKADIPMASIENAYTPTQTSLKAGFRASGADRQRDQDFAGGFEDDRFKDEDRLTNKSGDPRIGTHGRAYEPGEAR